MDKRKSATPTQSPNKRFKNDSNRRPLVRNLDSKATTLIFQQLELDHYIGTQYPGMPGAQTGPVPVMRMFGVSREGNSICCHIHGFSPYFYVSLPENFKQTDCYDFKTKLNAAVIADMRGNKDITEAVLMVQIVQGKSLVDYIGEDNLNFAKITVAIPRLIGAAKRLLESGNIIPNHYFSAYESNVDIDLRFMVDTKVLGCSWIELPAGKWFTREINQRFPLTSRCQIEVDVSWEHFIAHAPEGEWAKVAPFRLHSFDIECAGRKGIFPEANVDPVIQIANVVKLYGVEETLIRNVFTLNTCASIGHAEVRSFKTEKEMLEAWAEFVREIDPDVFTGYNINNFDMPYLLDRAKHLKLRNFEFLGRILSIRSVVKESTTQTKVGKRTFKTVNFEGRVVYDMFVVMKRDFKLRSYTLNNVSKEILGEQKEDVHYSIITDLQNGDEQTRRRLAVYCLKDADLPLRLLDHVKSFTNDIEMARVTGVPLTSLLTKGEQVKVVAQLLRHSQDAGYFMPFHQQVPSSDQYEGATVIEPIRGYYTDPIATLDFSSLYPSIMIAHNLCYTTLVRPNMKDRLGLTPDQITTTPAQSLFVKASVRPGLLPQILQQLLSARKRAKAELKDEKDPVMRAVLDGRQLALKISANSVYGFTGAQVGKLPCLEISGSVTAYGRTMIEQTRLEVEQHYCVANGYENDAKVIYGDTDSVMVNFQVKTLERSMELGREAAELISTKFIKPIKLEFEKVYFPYLLINKKRYAGLYFTRTDKYDKMDCKGIETVRRDNCTLVVDVINTCLQKLLINRTIQMERTKIPFASRPKQLTKLLPLPQLPNRVLQPHTHKKAQEEPLPPAPVRRILSRRSKSFSDIRTQDKGTELISRKCVAGNKFIKPLQQATSTLNLQVAKKPLLKPTLKTVPERLRVPTNNLPGTRTIGKRPAGSVEDVSKPKVAKPAKPAPYDYKARFTLLNETHTSLVQTFKEAKQKVVDAEKDLEAYSELKQKYVVLENNYETVVEQKTELELESVQLMKSIADLQSAYRTLKNECGALQANNFALQHQVSQLQNEKDRLLNSTVQMEHHLLDAKATIKDLQGELEEYKATLQSHEELRRMMHNQLQDLKGTIRVYCRVRPTKFQEQNKMLCCINCLDEATLEIKKSKESISGISGKSTDLKQEFCFDKVFPPEATQAEVFEDLSQLVQSALDGYHICVFAYGQTGSGKTFTMQGEDSSNHSGMIPRTIELIFRLIDKLKKSGWIYTVDCSFLEIYNEAVRDLLNPNSKQQHDICYNEGKGMTVTNLTIKPVESTAELHRLMASANRNRVVAATNFNEHSSRSHAVTKIMLSGVNEDTHISYIGSLSLVDLAGSESAKMSSGERITETKNINKSLSTLGTVMSALHNREMHVPYRNSKLTYLLQSCLGGNSKTLMFVNIAPFEECFSESVNALRFAAKVKEVKIGSKRNKTYLHK